MNNISALRNLDSISAITLYVSLIYITVSAYKRTKEKGFVFLGFAALGFLFTTPLPFQQPHPPARFADPSSRAILNNFHHGLSLANNVLALVGLVMLINGFLRLHEARKLAAIDRSKLGQTEA